MCGDSGDCKDDFVPLKPVSEEGEEEEGEGEREREERGRREVEKEEEKFNDMFEARLVIHQALHLPMMVDKTQ